MAADWSSERGIWTVEAVRQDNGETEQYKMIGADARNVEWLGDITEAKSAIVVMEGVSMYLSEQEVRGILKAICDRFDRVSLMMDCYTLFAAKASRYKNPINEVGVTEVYGVDDPRVLEADTGISFVREHEMTPKHLIESLKGIEKFIFRTVYGGKASKMAYRLYEFGKENTF